MKHTPIDQAPAVLEIRKEIVGLVELQHKLRHEGAELYKAQKNARAAPPPAVRERTRVVQEQVGRLLNGSTPPGLLVPPAESRDVAITIELEALDVAITILARREEEALDREAERRVAENGADRWKTLAREIVLTATRLASLEERARAMLEDELCNRMVRLPFCGHIGSGHWVLGLGDPLMDLRQAAVEERVVTAGEIRKAQNIGLEV